jgi:hypothetical protein
MNAPWIISGGILSVLALQQKAARRQQTSAKATGPGGIQRRNDEATVARMEFLF